MNSIKILRLAAIATFAFLALGAKDQGCSGEQPIGSNNTGGGKLGDAAGLVNPTGTCTADSDGSRECYSSADPNAPWIRDCKNPLLREYFRVSAFSETSAFMLPRPDGTGITFGICDGPDADLAGFFNGYGLCAESLGARVSRRSTVCRSLTPCA